MTNLASAVPPLVPQPAGAERPIHGDVTATPMSDSSRARYQAGCPRQSARGQRRTGDPGSCRGPGASRPLPASPLLPPTAKPAAAEQPDS